MFKYELGKKAKDKISGYSGIIVSRCDYLTGCDRYVLKSTELKDGIPIKQVSFDEVEIKVSKTKTGLEIIPPGFKFNNGDKVKSLIHGYTGIIRGRSNNMDGVNSYATQSEKLKENNPADWEWFSEEEITLVKPQAVILIDKPLTEGNTKSSTKMGGPLRKGQNPQRRF